MSDGQISQPKATEARQPPWKAGLMAMNAGKPLAQPGALQTLLDRYEAGESVQAIANSLGIKRQSIYRAFLTVPDWMNYQAASALADLEDARDGFNEPLKTGDPRADGVVVNACAQKARLAQWTLERTCRAIYGDRVTITNEIKPEDREILSNASELLKLFKEKEVPGQIVDERALTSNSLIPKAP